MEVNNFEKPATKPYSITLEKEQYEFIENQSRKFNLSKLVRVSLDAYIDYIKRLREEEKE